MKIYAGTEDACKEMFPDAVAVKPCNDTAFIKDIQIIKERCKYIGRDKHNREVYYTNIDDGKLYIKLSPAFEDDYYELAEYQFMENTATVYPILWVLSTPTEVVNKFFGGTLQFKRYSYRRFDEPRLTKPKELRGIKHTFSIPFLIWKGRTKATCSCFIIDDDLWVKHTDYFSPSFVPPNEDLDKPTGFLLKKYFNHNYTEKFLYPDCWGSIVLRSEAWLQFKNVSGIMKRDSCDSAAKTLLVAMVNTDDIAYKALSGSHNELHTIWEHFWEQVVKKYKEHVETR